MTKEDFVNDIFMTGLNIALFALPHKELLVRIGENEEMRQAAICHLKDMCSNIGYLLNGLRTEQNFERYSRDYGESERRWLGILREKGIMADGERKRKYEEVVREFVGLLVDAG